MFADGEVTSQNIVGYQKKTNGAHTFNYNCATFLTIGKDRTEMTLGDIRGEEGLDFTQIQFLTSEGGNDYVDNPGIAGKPARMQKSYTYFSDPTWATAGKIGWYLVGDDDGEFCMNDVELPFGQAVCVQPHPDEITLGITFDGEVQKAPTPFVFNEFKTFNYVGNCTPRKITLGEIVGQEGLDFTQIQFLTSEGGNDYVDNPGIAGKPARMQKSYTYFSDPTWATAGKIGWYLVGDDDGDFCMNDEVEIEAGDAFCVQLHPDEVGLGISIPAAITSAK